MRHYSCDSHVVEAREVFDGLEERFGSRAPRIVKDPPGKRGEYLVVPGTGPIAVGRLGIAGTVALTWVLMRLAFRSDRDGWDARADDTSDLTPGRNSPEA